MFSGLKKLLFKILSRSAGFNGVLFNHLSRDNICSKSSSYLDTNRVAGDVLHFGVSSGKDFTSLYQCFKHQKRFSRHFWLFDSFEGLPKPIDTLDGKYCAGKYAFSKEDFVAVLKREKVSLDDCTITKGYFSGIKLRIREKKPEGKAALVLLDCDLCESTIDALRLVEPFLQKGTIILAAEYFNYKADVTRGMAKAIHSYFKKEALVEWQPYGVSGMAFICR